MRAYKSFAYFVSVLLIAALSACSKEAPQEVATETADAPETAAPVSEFRAFLDWNYAEDMEIYPATASRRGLHSNDGAWNPGSEADNNAWRARIEKRLATLQEFDQATLSEKEQLSYTLYEQSLQRSIASDQFRRQLYPIHQFRGMHTYVPTFLANNHPVNSVADAQNYISRLRGVGELFDQTIEQVRLAEEAGAYLPDWSYPQLITTSRNTITGAPFTDGKDTIMWADIQAKIDALGLEAAQAADLKEQARLALVETVQPAYERLIAEFERVGAEAPAHDGVWKHPDGEAYYAERLNYFTTTDLTADEVHDIGLKNVERIHDEMRAIRDKVGFEGTLAEFFVFMREDEQFYYSNDEEGRARYLAEATEYIDIMREDIPNYFGILPKSELEVRRVEAFRERSAGKAFYQYPVPEAGRPGIYYANLYDMKSMPTYQMEALAYHEGIPGHHMQRAITVELDDIPEFQKYSSFTAYTEGWGLYTEMLPKEMGYYKDPYSDFGRLAMELWRAARLVVDTGLHHKRWTREEAIAYLVENTPNSEYDSTKAIERYAVMPGQATAYLIGKLRIVEMREEARAKLGDKFDIRGFHDEVLKDGQVPLSVLQDKIDRWVAAQL